MDMAVFAMLGAVMYVSKVIMEILPNVHLLAMFTAAFTLVYRKRALIPIYIYILLNGLFAGFAPWWIPYLYIWLPLWGAVMLVSRIPMSRRVQVPVYMVVCALHGLLFGTLYAPAQALMFGLNFQGMITWIIAGLPYDAIHAAGDFVAGALTLPLAELLRRLERSRGN